MKSGSFVLVLVSGLALCVQASGAEADGTQLTFVTIPAGTFTMGSDAGDWDESPVHDVTVSKDFDISTKEVPFDLYHQFRPDHSVTSASGSATGVSWYEATAFCAWLSDREGETYRLPTEAEWEYACRLNGGGPGDDGESGKLGLERMCDDVPEWCYDWHGAYLDAPQTDPVGPNGGMARVIRGGKIDDDSRYAEPGVGEFHYQRAANRAGMAPAFGPTEPRTGAGQHPIGFRIVRGGMPETKPYPREIPEVSLGVKQTTRDAAVAGPPADQPYFRKRYLLPSPPETVMGFDDTAVAEHIRKMRVLGLHPSFRGHNHSPAVEVMPNGDLLMVTFTSWREYEPGMSLMATRLRFGADQWDMPSCLVDMPDACDNTPLLWTEGDTVRLFFSSTRAFGGFPFNWTESTDSGATWSEVRFPKFTTEIGPHSRQPINTLVRDKAGTVYLPSDGDGASSVLWRSSDNLQTWQDPGGRTGGRHTTIALLKDGMTLLGMGGKSSDIGGYMPKSISRDGGATWDVSATQFPAYGSNQRPTVLRLQSGRLFFCGDLQRIDGAAPDTVEQRGSFVALSDDDGETWHVKKLAGAQPHEAPEKHNGADTIGYSVARQAQNGVIHLITTMNEPCLHLAMNEAWILSDDEMPSDDGLLMKNSATSVDNVSAYRETYPNGQNRIEWSAGIGNDGRYLLHGTETRYYEDGSVQYAATFDCGVKVGEETAYRRDGSREWQWNHNPDGTSKWTQWWPNGAVKSESTWRDFHAEGMAKRWDASGNVKDEHTFTRGK